MIRLCLILSLLFTAGFAHAQQRTTVGSGAIIRVLDRVNGETKDYEMRSGSTIETTKLLVKLNECRYPRRRLNRDAFANFVITDMREDKAIFDGWMVASSPALSALEHSRYDVWVLKCLAP